VFGLTVAGALFYVRLLHGPISLQIFVKPIEAGIGEELPGYKVRVAAAAVRLGEHGGLEFELSHVQINDADGSPVALAPTASVALSRPALMRGRIAPERVLLIGPKLLLYYSEDGTLALRFSRSPEAAEERPLASGTPRGAVTDESASTLRRIDLFKSLSDVSARARRRQDASAFLRTVGLENATLIVDDGARKSIWRMPDLMIDVDHRSNHSSISGHATIASLSGPFELDFKTFEAETAKTLQLTLAVRGFVPRGLARSLPQLAVLESFDVPLAGEVKFDVSTAGEILSGSVALEAAAGRMFLPWLDRTPLRVDAGRLELSYSASQRRFDIAPSTLMFGDSRLQFDGAITYRGEGEEGPGWLFNLRTVSGTLAAEQPGAAPVVIDQLQAQGVWSPALDQIVLGAFVLKAGGSEVRVEGRASGLAGNVTGRLEGRVDAMPAAVFKALWPRSLAPRTREWIVPRLVRGTVQSGSMVVTSEGAGGPSAAAGESDPNITLNLELAGLELTLANDLPALEASRGLVRFDDKTLEITVPDASLALDVGRSIGLKIVRFAVNDVRSDEPVGEVSAKVQAPMPSMLELLEREPFQLFKANVNSLSGIDGKFEGQFRAVVPLATEFSMDNMKFDGRARISDGKARQLIGSYDVSGINLAVEISEKALEAKGDLSIRGVAAKLGWQQIFAAPADQQPPLRVTATLAPNDRVQLGLDINDEVRGDLPIEIAISRDAKGEPQVRVRADLTNAELVLDTIAWRKPPGGAATYQFDVTKGTTYKWELQNVQLVGDGVAIAGWMGIGPDNRVKEYAFPDFSVNVITRLDVQGKLRPENVWDVKVRGATYDGRDIFRSLFSIGQLSERPPPSGRQRPGLDLSAEIDNVVGFSDASLRSVRLRLKQRADKLVALDLQGTLEGGKPFVAIVRQEPGQPRRLLAEAKDAGQIFKLVGFYPNAVGGHMNLEVNLEGKGPVERNGILWAREFAVLGDPVVSEVLQPAQAGPEARGRRRIVRQQFDFDHLRIPFSVGQGQFVMDNAYMAGPLVGATMRGKVDFKAQTLHVGGTYVPLSGLNSAVGAIPIVGQILAGPQGEGLLGMTFAIQGSLTDPQVTVNPLSMVAPGILREIFQMAPVSPKVQPRSDKPATSKSDSAARGSGAPTSATPVAPQDMNIKSEILSGWSIQKPQNADKR
jgi:AsmA-like C-terminal region/Protein of unknown function